VPAGVDHVLAHIQSPAAQPHPCTLATGLHDMTNERWRACVAALHERGYPIATTVCAGGGVHRAWRCRVGEIDAGTTRPECE
jgi:hypothetical protein